MVGNCVNARLMWAHFLIGFTRVHLVLREIKPRCSRLEPVVAEDWGFPYAYVVRLGSLVIIDSQVEYQGVLIQDWIGSWYRSFSDRQPPTLTARLDRLLAVFYGQGRPVAQKMRTGLLYTRTVVLGNRVSKRLFLF